MDEQKKIIDAFYNAYLEDSYDFHGIKIKPIKVDDRIFYQCKNPNDLSVSKSRIIDFAVDLFWDFSKFVGGSEVYYKYNNRCSEIETDIEFTGKVYLNDSDTSKILSELKKIKQINFKNIILDIEIFDFEFDNSYGEDFYMGFNTNILGGYVSGEKIKTKDSLVDVISSVFYDDDFRDSEFDLFQSINRIVAHNPLLFNINETYLTHSITPYNKMTGELIHIN